MATAPMIPPAAPAEVRTVLRTISWETYRRLAEENQSKATRFAFFDGVLEIVTVSGEHEFWIDLFANLISGVLNIDLVAFGQATLRRNDLHAGMEPDACFYVRDTGTMRRLKTLDLSSHPAPDIAVEVDIGNSSLEKLSLFAALGVPEVWRYSGGCFLMYRLGAAGGAAAYQRVSVSKALPGVTAAMLAQLLSDSESMTNPDCLDHVRKTASR